MRSGHLDFLTGTRRKHKMCWKATKQFILMLGDMAQLSRLHLKKNQTTNGDFKIEKTIIGELDDCSAGGNCLSSVFLACR